MRSLKSSISKLKTAINNKFSNDDDLFGNEGISRATLTAALNSSYNLLKSIDEHKDSYEVPLFRRNILPQLQQAHKLLATTTNDESFDSFLEIFEIIRSRIKNTYFLVTQGTLRSEEEIGLIREQLREFRTVAEEYKTTHNEIKGVGADVEEKQKRIKEIDTTVAESAGRIGDLMKIATQTAEQMTTLSAESSTSQNNITNTEVKITEIEANYSSKKEQIVSLATQASEHSKSIAESARGNI